MPWFRNHLRKRCHHLNQEENRTLVVKEIFHQEQQKYIECTEVEKLLEPAIEQTVFLVKNQEKHIWLFFAAEENKLKSGFS